MQIAVLAIGVAVLSMMFGCQGPVLPLSAQAGSTVLIPLTGDGDNLGYGGTAGEDYQRGTLVYQLDGPGGFELMTRASSAVAPVANATVGLGFAAKRQIVSLVDIPANAPLGRHTLHVKRRRLESGLPVDYTGPEYNGEITILPNEVEFEVGGTPVTSVGAPTPFERWNCDDPPCEWSTVNVGGAIPMPEIRLVYEDLVEVVAAVELEVEYPADVIDVIDVYAMPNLSVNHPGVVWFDDDAENGVLRIGASMTSIYPLIQFGISFSLEDGATEILDTDDVDVTVENAWDSNGDAISISFVKGIF
jgi:hypothetical protein